MDYMQIDDIDFDKTYTFKISRMTVEPSYIFMRILRDAIKKIFGCKFEVYYMNNIKDFSHQFYLETDDGMVLEVIIEQYKVIFNLDLCTQICKEFVDLYKEIYGGNLLRKEP